MSSSPWYSKGNTIPKGDFPYKCECPLYRGTYTWLSVLLPHLLFVYVNQPKIIHIPKTHVLGGKLCSPSIEKGKREQLKLLSKRRQKDDLVIDAHAYLLSSTSRGNIYTSKGQKAHELASQGRSGLPSGLRSSQERSLPREGGWGGVCVPTGGVWAGAVITALQTSAGHRPVLLLCCSFTPWSNGGSLPAGSQEKRL